ncbi:MAG: hypothetical protein BAA01_05895 [Bacillus thermozeamaize]|uniref:Sodium:solute symporter n=1 Tax=Bacillus thermozeamaize TaxID=230954 RepID=A0A1Y3PK34_9BACI|nr:MAG: hypothetical protein BAA01_05895 [Bacillus thermozeamaize]
MMVYTIGVLCSFMIYIALGVYLSRRVKTSEEYYVSGRNGSTLMVTGTLVASFVSTVSFMGEVGFSYDGYPILLLILVIFNASGYVLGVFLFGRYLRRSRSLTVPEFFGRRFHSNKVRSAAAVTTILGISAYLVAVTQGVAVILSELLNVSYAAALIITWIAYSSFTILSGARGVLVNDTIMFMIFSFATYLSLPFIFHAAGGFPEAIVKAASLPSRPDMLSWHGLTGPNAYMGTPMEALVWAIILGLVWGAVVAISPWQSSRYLMAKNEHVVIRSGVLATISILTIYLFLHLSVSAIATINDSIKPSEKAFIWAAMNVVPTWLGVIIITGIFAAGLSSCASFLQLIGNSFTRDLMEQARNKTYSDAQLLRWSRIVMFVVSVIILLVGLWQPPSIMWIGYFAATLFAASWGPVAVASVYSKKVTENGAFWSIIFGFLGVFLGEILKKLGVELPVYLHPVIIGVVLASAAMMIGSKFGSVTEEEKAFREMITTRVVSPDEDKEMSVTKKYPYVLVFSGVALILFTFVFYYWPFTMAQ